MKFELNITNEPSYSAAIVLNDSDFVASTYQLDVEDIELEVISQYLGTAQALIYSQPKSYDDANKTLESYRKAGATSWSKIKEQKIKSIAFKHDTDTEFPLVIAFIEGLLLASYSFDKYLTEKAPTVQLDIEFALNDTPEFQEMLAVVEANALTKNLVNEPVITLNTQQFSEEMKTMGDIAGFKVTVLEKKQIESLKMGGLLAVNKGSIDPPAFNILEYTPENAVNDQPFVLVGKGVVYDTGGYNIKTDNHMNDMKLDMGGAAAVLGSIYAIAKNKLPVKVIGLIPATDNRIGGNALVADDVITMHNGKTVEVKNTDAEGRLILADALSYAQQYKPELVFDMATLTGASVMLTGDMASCVMGNANKETFSKLAESGFATHERVAEVPFWEDYQEMLKSNIADLSNLGGRVGGVVTAGKFLENFVDYPWIHIDLAGPAFVDSDKDYRQKGGTAYGVRLVYDFVKKNWLK